MPLLMQRTEVINKRLDPSDIDIKAEGALIVRQTALYVCHLSVAVSDSSEVKLPPPAPRDSESDDSDDEHKGTPGVPGFWLQAMSNNEVGLASVPVPVNSSKLTSLESVAGDQSVDYRAR